MMMIKLCLAPFILENGLIVADYFAMLADDIAGKRDPRY